MCTYRGQAEQDKFVVNILNGKRNGYFLEIGSNHPININNTFILERKLSWKGIMIEYSEEWLNDYKRMRPNSIYIINDATKIDYRKLLQSFPKNIDYLQIDIEASNGSTINTLEKLDNEIMDKYKFAVITFEHDFYASGNYMYTREKSRRIFEKYGYFNVFKDINDNNPNVVYEDWWVHPSLVDMKYVIKLKELNTSNYKENHLTNLSINWKDITYPNEFELYKDKIIIGNSNSNSKTIRLNKSYPSDTKLFFVHNYYDTFSYVFKDSNLSITRTDENFGWGQELIAYL